MVRTRADAGATRATGAKAPRKNLAGPSTVTNSNSNTDKSGKGREHTGGNSYFPRETPEWQKPITSFFNRPSESGESSKRTKKTRELIADDSEAGTSTSGGSTSKENKTD